MTKAINFTFEAYSLDKSRTTATFNYSIDYQDGSKTNLSEKLLFPVTIPDSLCAKQLFQALHIGLGISYYKVFLPPTFTIKYQLSQLEADFWNSVYRNGLSEFLYVNKLSVSKIATFEGSSSLKNQASIIGTEAKAILGLGGGKDSILAGELLKSLAIPVTGYVLATGDNHGQTQQVAKIMGVDLIGVQRIIDPQILELNKQPEAYNGHIPISLIFALVGLLLCVATKTRYIVVANEASSSLPNTEWQGKAVNHQWSKSLEFEQSLQDFVHNTIASDLDYFSAIRSLSSVAVMKLFAQFPSYLDIFTSCNRVFRIDRTRRPNNRWCGECPKDLSTFILLAPWINQEVLLNIFGKNLFEDSNLEKLFLELTGLEGHRPLDCVGTKEEAILSLNLIAQQGKLANTYLLEVARKHRLIIDKDWSTELMKALTPSHEQAIPTELKEQLYQLIQKRLAR